MEEVSEEVSEEVRTRESGDGVTHAGEFAYRPFYLGPMRLHGI